MLLLPKCLNCVLRRPKTPGVQVQIPQYEVCTHIHWIGGTLKLQGTGGPPRGLPGLSKRPKGSPNYKRSLSPGTQILVSPTTLNWSLCDPEPTYRHASCRRPSEWRPRSYVPKRSLPKRAWAPDKAKIRTRIAPRALSE